MSDETTTNPAADAAPTQPLPQAAPAAATPAEAPVAAMPAAAPTAVPAVQQPVAPAAAAGSSASRWVFAVSAAIVLAVALSATSFGAGVLVGKMGAGRAPVAMMQGSQMTAPDSGTDSDTGTQRGDYGRGRGNGQGGGFPGHPGGMGNSGQMNVPGQQQSTPTQ